MDLDTLKNYWDGFVQFLTEYDSQKIMELLRSLDWNEIARSPIAWGLAISVVAYSLWKKQVRYLILGISLVLFVFLLQHTIPPAGENLSLSKLLTFLGGCVALMGVNVYFMFIREG